jgi:hypothetical protein
MVELFTVELFTVELFTVELFTVELFMVIQCVVKAAGWSRERWQCCHCVF